jgi:hypothetical protein
MNSLELGLVGDALRKAITDDDESAGTDALIILLIGVCDNISRASHALEEIARTSAITAKTLEEIAISHTILSQHI